MKNGEFYFEQVGPFVLMPVLHHSFEFAVAAAEAFRKVNPCAVALEYPHGVQDLILKGIQRLPKVSILLIGKRYIRIEPVDAFIEAARLAAEDGLPVRCIDLYVSDYPDMNEAFPDPYALSVIGHKAYCAMVLPKIGNRLEMDEIRERGMAFHLQTLRQQLEEAGAPLFENRPIFVVCGLSHLNGLRDQLKQRQAQPFAASPPAKLYHLSSDSLGEIMGVFPFLTSVYELQRTGSQEPRSENVGQPRVESETGLQLIKGQKAQDLNEFVSRAYRAVAENTNNDRRDILTQFIFQCRSHYEQEIGDRLNPHSMILLHRFAQKYSRIKKMLLPDFYELLISGRNCINSHFCYRMWEIGTAYPPQQGATDLEIIELRASDLFPFIQKVRMNPNAPLKPRFPRFLRRNEKQRKPKDQELQFHPFSICSYQPEDLVIENYGRYLRSKGKSMLSEERKRVRPFETSLLDGIDLRETIRNWHSGDIYVQEFQTVKGSVDALVVIYDKEDSKYPYTMTWLGEHHQESDMAFYATDPEERPVGPGIRKSVYGGFLMTMPPGRLFDVFHDPAYSFAENHAERLLLAAIDYGIERFVLYSAPQPPRPLFQVIAGRYGKRILYLPLAQLSPLMLQKIRTFHILADKSVREYAKDYVW